MSRYEFAAGDEITAAKLNKNIIGGSYNAGETINGATLPVPVYQADDTYKLDSISQESGNNYYVIYGTEYTCQTFKVDTPNYSNLKLDKISLYLQKYNSPSGNFTVEIYAVDGDNKPTGSVLASANMAANSIAYGYNDFEFDYEFDYDTTYAIVAKCTDGNSSNYVMWYYQNSNMYTNGQVETSSDGGSTWSIHSSYDFRFKVYYNYKFGDVGEFYKSDANDINRLNFVGFAISNGTDGNPIDIQFNGIVKGFSGLEEGKKYYVTNTTGSIGLDGGTNKILVGVAISATELFIIKNKRIITGTFTDSVEANNNTVTSDTEITTGFLPRKISVLAKFGNGSVPSDVMYPHVVASNGIQPATPSYYINGICIGYVINESSGTIVDSSIYLAKYQHSNSPTNSNALSIQAIDNTKVTFRLTHTYSSASPNTGYVLCRYIIEE